MKNFRVFSELNYIKSQETGNISTSSSASLWFLGFTSIPISEFTENSGDSSEQIIIHAKLWCMRKMQIKQKSWLIGENKEGYFLVASAIRHSVGLTGRRN